jgi:hypothetical protein
MIDKPSNSAMAHSLVVAGLLALQTAHSLRLVTRFGLTGRTTTLAYFLLTNGFVLLFKMTAVNSSVCADLVSVAISYLLQSRFTFCVNGLAWSGRAVSPDIAGRARGFLVRNRLRRSDALALSDGRDRRLPHCTGHELLCHA